MNRSGISCGLVYYNYKCRRALHPLAENASSKYQQHIMSHRGGFGVEKYSIMSNTAVFQDLAM